MSLEDWQQAFDTVNDYWNDRRVAICKMETQAGWLICFRVASMLFGPYVLSCMVKQRDWQHQCLLFMLSLVWEGWNVSMMMSSDSPEMAIRFRSQDTIDQLDKKLSYQIELMGKKFRFQKYGILVGTMHVIGHINDSVGIGFSFRVQLADEEDVAWINANSQKHDHSGFPPVEHDNLLITKEPSSDPLVGRKVVAAAESDSTLSEGANEVVKRIPVVDWNENTDAAILEESITAAFSASCGRPME